MKFVAIKPKTQTLEWIETDTLLTAQLAAGLKDVDHGTFWRRPDSTGAFVVYEFGFFVPVIKQTYATVFGCLLAGTAVVYAFNPIGDTISVEPDMITEKDITWLPTQYDVEIAISRGMVRRPIIAVNGVVKWSWPSPPPADFAGKKIEGRD